MELTEKFLVSMGGWPVFKEARSMHAAGRISEASYEPPLLKGKISEGAKQFFAGLRIRNAIDVENLCPCRDSRVRGIICAHSLAVGLQVLKPASAASRAEAAPVRATTASEATEELPVVELQLEGSLRHLEAEINFRYSRPGIANPARETEALMQLAENGFRDFKGKAALQGEDAVIKFFGTVLPKLKEKWNVREGERFRHVTKDFVRIEPQFAIRDRDDGWLDFHVHYAAGSEAVFSVADLSRLLQSGQSHVRLKDGRVAVADPSLPSELEEVLHDCNPRQERGGYRVPPACRDYLESAVAQWSGKEPVPSKIYAVAGDLGTLRTALRPYQVDGAVWLLDKARAGLGGLLADEMGLGKTVQTLAMIEALDGPSLVVCPSSLVWNWKREAEKFLPGLPVLALDGPAREKLFEAIPRHRLIVTSYALLRRDIDRYKHTFFSAAILDEAQHIKNPDSLNAKAACAIDAASRFILTGTPVENSIRDLWSLFEFFLPGYLGNREDFRDRYETPLLNGATGSTWARLSQRIRPYILRRKKAEILTELPDKIEQVIEVELTGAQKAAYTQLQQAARASMDDLKRQGNSGAARMRAITALLRLRQACCDLRLLGGELEAGEASAKMTALLELVGEAMDGGHRVLVFSQFTSMLDLMAQALEELKIPFVRLDGSTRRREEVVTRFQEDASIPVFLISLKAGGVGLNLTAADTVIHFDPWWNPAVEAQATDRAHRIGQKQVVNSIKLIARDTVEDRILRMQRSKRELFENALDGEAAMGRLTDADMSELVA